MNNNELNESDEFSTAPEYLSSDKPPFLNDDLNVFPKGEVFYRGIASDHLSSGG